MDGQITIAEYLNEKPPVGSIIYFITCNKVKKAVVINHDASFAGLSYEGYFKVQEKNGQIWRIKIKTFYNSLAEAKGQLT